MGIQRTATAALCAAFIASSSPARADVKSDIYDDVKTIITDLITKDVAENTVEEIACRAGHVKLDAKPDSSDAATVIDIVVDEKKDIHEYYELQALKFFPGTMRRLYAGQFAGLKTTFRSEAADLAGHLVYTLLADASVPAATTLRTDRFQVFQEALQKTKARPTVDEVANTLQVSISKIAATERSDALMIARLVEAPSNVAGTLYHFLDTSTYGPIKEHHGKCKTAVLNKLKDGIGTTPSQLDKECAGQTSVRCELAEAVRSAIVDDDKSAREHFVRAFSLALNEKEVDALTAAVLGQIGADMPLAKVKEAYVGLVDDWVKLGPLLNQLRMIAASSTRFDMSQLRALATTAKTLCGKVKTIPGCAQFDALLNNEAIKQLLPLLEAALRGDAHETVHLVIELILQRNRSNDECDEVEQCTKSLYESFFETLAYYVIEASQTGNVSEDTRAAFRTAAEDVIRYRWPGGYVRGGRLGFRIRPDFALRAAWNEGYVSPDGSSYRTAAAVPWLLWRYPVFYTNVVYVGVNASALDLLAPLAEFSLRPNAVHDLPTHYQHDEWVWANVVAPRFDVELGLPPLSSHLMVDIGAALRLAVAHSTGITTDEFGQMRADFRYRAPWDEKADPYRSLELSLSLKYVP